MEHRQASPLSAGLVNSAILLYILWLMIPAVQTTGGAAAGALCVALFGAGVLLDVPYLKKEWAWLLARAACAALMPLILWQWVGRGGTNFWGYYVQQGMFWLPLVFVGYARDRGDARLWRFVKYALLFAVVLTTLTTIGWLIQGMLRGGRVYAYSRSLGSGEPGRDAYLKELMLRNIGGYGFVYATVLSLPLTCIGVASHRAWKRAAFIALFIAQVVMVVLSQYTYAMVFAAAIVAVELVALVVRALSKGRVGVGASLLWGLLPIALVALFHRPLIALAASLCAQLGLTNFAFSFEQLLIALQGGATDEAARLGAYLTALDGIRSSPLIGVLLGGEARLSLHSDVLDILSALGILGAAVVSAMLWLMGRKGFHGFRPSPHRAQLCVMLLALLATATLGTVCYSCELPLVAAVGCALVLEG